jgi:hypothetical protein
MFAEWLGLILIAGVFVIAIFVNFWRLVRNGISGKQLFIRASAPISILMQGESLKRGMPVAQFQPLNPPEVLVGERLPIVEPSIPRSSKNRAKASPHQ